MDSLAFTAGQTAAVTITTTTAAPLTFNLGSVLDVDAGNHHFIGTGTDSSGTDYDLVFGGTTNGTYALDVASGSSFEIQGRIGSTGGSTSSRSYTKTGDGTLILSGQSGSSGAWNFREGSGFLVGSGVLRMTSSSAWMLAS